jgi:hypothetical protein
MKRLLLLLHAGISQAALRFGCSSVSIQRLDPLVEPGNIPSAHVHQIVGGNAFNATMTGDIGEQGTCTTCAYTEGMTTLISTTLLNLETDFDLRFFELLDRCDVFQTPKRLV